MECRLNVTDSDRYDSLFGKQTAVDGTVEQERWIIYPVVSGVGILTVATAQTRIPG